MKSCFLRPAGSKEKIDFIKSKICDILELIIGTVVAIVIAIIVITSIFFLINGEIGLFATGIFLAASIAGLIIGWIEEMSGPVFWTVFVIQWASFFLMKILP